MTTHPFPRAGLSDTHGLSAGAAFSCISQGLPLSLPSACGRREFYHLDRPFRASLLYHTSCRFSRIFLLQFSRASFKTTPALHHIGHRAAETKLIIRNSKISAVPQGTNSGSLIPLGSPQAKKIIIRSCIMLTHQHYVQKCTSMI